MTIKKVWFTLISASLLLTSVVFANSQSPSLSVEGPSGWQINNITVGNGSHCDLKANRKNLPYTINPNVGRVVSSCKIDVSGFSHIPDSVSWITVLGLKNLNGNVLCTATIAAKCDIKGIEGASGWYADNCSVVSASFTPTNTCTLSGGSSQYKETTGTLTYSFTNN